MCIYINVDDGKEGKEGKREIRRKRREYILECCMLVHGKTREKKSLHIHTQRINNLKG